MPDDYTEAYAQAHADEDLDVEGDPDTLDADRDDAEDTQPADTEEGPTA